MMLDPSKLCLNRIACPTLGLEAFFDLAGSLGISKVELRNDLAAASVTDNRDVAEIRDLADAQGLRIVTVNALQKFNLAAVRGRAEAELAELLATCDALGCPALVLCPNNDPADGRERGDMFRETVAALAAFRPHFEEANIQGLVEPLGFPESSLRSLVDAQRAIAEAGGSCYQTVHDTFHHHLGPDSAATIGGAYDVKNTGLVHLSGVEAEVPGGAYRDPHRVLVGPGDRLASKSQIAQLLALGFAGPISFEPFAPSVQAMEPKALREALDASIAYLNVS